MTSFDDNQTGRKFLATSTTEKLLLAFTVLLILLSSVYLISKSLTLNFGQYQQYRSAIVELQEQDSIFNQEILKSRYELFADYDPLVRSLATQKTIAARLQDIPDLGFSDERQAIEPILSEIRTSLENRENLSERFKSRNALLKNSLRYLPLLTTKLEAKFEAQEQAQILTSEQISSLRTTLNSLIRNLLLYNVAAEEKLESDITALSQRLAQLDVQYELSEEQFPTEIVKSHANIILKLKPQIEQLTAQLLEPLDQYTKSLEATIDNSYQQAVDEVGVYRLLTLFWFLMLLIVANYFLLKRWQQINPGLSRYKKQIGKLTAVLTELSQSQQVASETDNPSGLTSDSSDQLPDHLWSPGDASLATLATVPSAASKSELVALADRPDELGQLAQRVQDIVGKRVESEQVADDEKSLASLTACLTLITQNRQRMISPTTIESLKNLFEQALKTWGCQLIDLQGSLEQVQIIFSYPPQVQLLPLVAQLKAVSASYLEQNLGDIITNINHENQIWSSSYALHSCDVPSSMITEQSSITSNK